MTRPDPRLPRYQQIRDDIADRIAKGEWKAGEAIATEAELSQIYGVAIGTIRRAIDELAGDSLIDRVQGRGMFVRRADFTTSLFRFFRLDTRAQANVVPTGVILQRTIDTPSAEIRRHLDLVAGEDVVWMKRLRMDGTRILLREEIFLPENPFRAILDVDLDELSPLLYPAYERLFGKVVARAKERLTVQVADAALAEDLGTAVGAPVVRIERLAVDHAGRPLEWRVSHGPADTFVYEADVH